MKIGIVNDMAMAAEVLRRIVVSIDGCEVVWIARDGQEAVGRCAQDSPELILMDLMMPVMNGVEATRQIMLETPCPILIVTASVTGSSDLVYEALGNGALDVVATPSVGSYGKASGAEALVRKIKQIGLVTGVRARRSTPLPTASEAKPDTALPLIAIGSSTGGPNALAAVLGKMPGDLAAPIVIVQHVDEQFANGLADWLGKSTKLAVQLARRGHTPKPGNAYVAATNDHLTFSSSLTFSYSEEPRELPYRPSVDVFFNSAAKHWPGPIVAALLTGMGRDGAEGLLVLRQAGHATIAQDKATSVVYGMPKAAAENGAAAEILPIGEIGRAALRNLPPVRP
jgi:two-component system, chemotaxis family, response regulator WspF